MNELTTQDQFPIPVPSVAGMLQTLIESGNALDNVGALEKMMDLYERDQDRRAAQEFAAAFVELQKDTPRVEATKIVPNDNGTTRYTFAPYEQIMKQVQPMLSRHGFTVAFDSELTGEGARERVVVTCTLMHAGGHSKSNKFAALIGNGPPKSSGAQADGAANTYARRSALCYALNIVTGVDTDGVDDARAQGEPVDAMAAEVLEKRAKEVGANIPAFLSIFGVDAFKDFPSNRLEEAHDKLDAKERKNMGAAK